MAIKAERVSVRVGGASRPLLSDVSCTLESGQVTLLIGRNGAGKTTLLDVLGGLATFEGSITVDGLPLMTEKRGVASGLERTGQLFQYPEAQLFARSVRGEFDYSLRYLKLPGAEAKRRTEEAMREFGLAPELAGQSPLLLSGGEKRRVALASTVAPTPDWLLLDEPTAGLDPEAAEELLASLLRRKASGVGLVVATHDLDLLLPIADRVIALRGGRIAFDRPAAELAAQPELWAHAQLGKPLCVELTELLRESGESAPAAFWTPAEAADAWAAQLGRREAEGAAPSADSSPQPPEAAVTAVPEPLLAGNAGPSGSDDAAGANPSIRSLDPRSKWLFYMIFSIGIFVQRDWFGLGIGFVLTAALVIACRVPIRSLTPFVRPLLGITAISAVVSGIGMGGKPGEAAGLTIPFGNVELTFSIVSALATTLEFMKILCVLVGGILLSATTTPLEMKRGIEKLLMPLVLIRFPAEALSLAASLLLRFVPVLRKEAGRFGRIAKSRGKRVRRSGKMRLRDLPAMFVPLLLSLLQLASDLTLALEARGYTRTGLRRTSAVTLRLTRRDGATFAASAALLAVMLALPRLI
ncbi:ATP-binding cassette domain-containing protein [Paenibacillus ginsengarvi]|uniref:ATP-binding cassette domain-containing protein n=1 Tax=Paenibacillus ginsengarvi TaxID=400777 RepID=A0A3B0BXL0_9BACL|nr:ATP-binding cassette domain-containing protein [Paenibacillus ginsengarvi]RKN78213.1 ATP-binding cassette domain-containing protein [Paenibacillus ginsengarvi]